MSSRYLNSIKRLALQDHPSVCLAFMLAVLLSSSAASAQFDSGSDGSDGALDFTGTPSGTTIIFNPRDFDPPLDPDGDNVYHFTSITIPAGVTVRLLGSQLNMRPVFWLASGAVQIDGSIDLSGQPGHIANVTDRFPSEPGPGGYPGGIGSRGLSLAQPGSGPGGGGVSTAPADTAAIGGGAGYATAGGDGFSNGGSGGPAYGNTFLVPLLGGSGGGGGQLFSFGGGGGAGGGAILIASSVSITVGGLIDANGGRGGAFSSTNSGGGGSGGAIHLKAPVVRSTGSGFLQGRGGGSGGPGSPGRIRIEALQQEFALNQMSPPASFAAPLPVFLPTNPPSVRVVTVAGVPVPPNPTGSFEMPDVPIDEGAAAMVMIEARNIPPGTIADLHLFSQDGEDQTVSEPLTGTMELSEAMMEVAFPIGFSHAFVRADFTP